MKKFLSIILSLILLIGLLSMTGCGKKRISNQAHLNQVQQQGMKLKVLLFIRGGTSQTY